jgi:hypothetical protein
MQTPPSTGMNRPASMSFCTGFLPPCCSAHERGTNPSVR